MHDPIPPRLTRINGKGKWLVYFERRRTSTGTTERKEAERFLADFKAGIARPEAMDKSVKGLLAAYLANRIKRKKPGAERLGYAHKALLTFFGEMQIDDINGDSCLDYLEQRGVASRTVRTELEALRAALNWGQTAEGGRVVKEMPDLELPAKGNGRQRWLTRDEANRLLDGCIASHLRLFVALALHTAARRGAILTLKWDRVDFENRIIDYRNPDEIATNKRKVPVKINDTLHAILSAAKGAASTGFVIERAGRNVDSIKHGFRDACIRAGLTGVTPHTLRHTAITWMMHRRVTIWDAAGFAGMTPEMVSKIYGHHHPDFGKDAATALER
jgi:integrase